MRRISISICRSTTKTTVFGLVVKKSDVRSDHLIVELEKFALRIMKSAGVSFGGKGRLYFVDEKVKVIMLADYFQS